VTDGVAILAELFASTGDLDYVYNQGRCYQQNNRPDEAIARFREYLRRARVLSKGDRDEVESFIKELEAERDANARRRAAPAPATPPAPVSSGEPAVAATAEPAGSGASAGFDGRRVGQASLLAGGALLVGGGVSWLIANGQYSSLEEDCNKRGCTVSRYESGSRSVRTWDRITDVALVGGAIGVLGGLAAYVWWSPRPGERHPVGAVLDPVSRSASLVGRF
jgi:hypothetical protein